MTCTEYQEQIALLVSGDLPEQEAALVQRHVDECSECQKLSQELAADREAVQDLAAWPDDAARQQLRAGVLSRLQPQRQQRKTWLWQVAAAAGLLLAAVTAAVWQIPAPDSLSTVELRRAVPKISVPPVPVEVASRINQPKIPRKTGPSEKYVAAHRKAAEPQPGIRSVSLQKEGDVMAIKMTTNDPNVVIYWLTNDKGVAHD